MFCGGCGAPLALRPEPPPRPLDSTVSLDRRAGARPGDAPPTLRDLPPAATPPPRAAAPPPRAPHRGMAPMPPARPPEPAPADARARSSWDLGPLHAPAPPRSPAPATAPDGFTMGDGAPPPTRELELGDGPRSAPTWGPGSSLGALVLGPDAPAPAPRATLAGGAAAASADDAAGVDDGFPAVDVAPLEVHLRRPATWRRTAAWLVDAVPFAALFAAGLGALHPGGAAGGVAALARAIALGSSEAALAVPLLLGVAIGVFVYHALCHALAGATLGKWIFGLRVVGPDGRRPTIGRSAARGALAGLSVALLGLGLLAALFTRSGRALHDLLARTWVVEPP